MWGRARAGGQQTEQLALVAVQLLCGMEGEVHVLEAHDVDPLEEHQVEGDPRNPCGEPDRDEPAAPVEAAQRRL